jgi:hypothetical protein
MKTATLVASLALGLVAGAALAQPVSSDNPPKSTILCLDVSGKILPATCRVPASRLDAREDICSCPMGGDRVTAPVCPKGVSPPAESAAYEKARHAAVSRGSLVGAMYEGKPMCVAARNAVGGN